MTRRKISHKYPLPLFSDIQLYYRNLSVFFLYLSIDIAHFINIIPVIIKARVLQIPSSEKIYVSAI